METKKTNSKRMLWTGRIITALCLLFLIIDGGMKAIKAIPSMEATVELGWPENLVQAAGLILLSYRALFDTSHRNSCRNLTDRISRGSHRCYGTVRHTLFFSGYFRSLYLGLNIFKKRTTAEARTAK